MFSCRCYDGRYSNTKTVWKLAEPPALDWKRGRENGQCVCILFKDGSSCASLAHPGGTMGGSKEPIFKKPTQMFSPSVRQSTCLDSIQWCVFNLFWAGSSDCLMSSVGFFFNCFKEGIWCGPPYILQLGEASSPQTSTALFNFSLLTSNAAMQRSA